MAIVTKTIDGIQYLYYQDRGAGGHKVVSTLIGRADLDRSELVEARGIAFAKHAIKLYESERSTPRASFHFENRPQLAVLHNVDSLEQLKAGYQILRKSLTLEELQESEQTFFVKYVHGTTAIEGNTFTESEAARVLLNDRTVANKSINETLEIANYKEVKKFVDNYSGPITENAILKIHELLMNGIKDEIDQKPVRAGQYRTISVIITESDHHPPPPEKVSRLMRTALEEYQNRLRRSVHPIEASALFHLDLEQIHPFEDGNGRLGREVLNYMLVSNGYPAVFIPKDRRGEYLRALHLGDARNFVPIVEFIYQRLYATLEHLMTRAPMNKLMRPQYSDLLSTLLGSEAHNRLLSLMPTRT